MKYQECTRPRYLLVLICALLVALAAMTGCKNAEATKAEHVRRGEAFLKEKKFQEATIEFRNALQIDEKLASAHWGLAQSYEGLERWQEAFDEMKRAVELDPNNLDARVRIGNYYLLGKQIPDAERYATEVLQKDPNHIEGHILLAGVLFAQDKRDQALAELNHAVSINPKRVESYLSLAQYYGKVNDTAKAEETYRQAISVNNASALAHSEYGKFLVQANRMDEAEVEFRRAVEAEPANRDSRQGLAAFYVLTKRMDKAEEAYKALAELDKTRPEGRAMLADFYSSVGRYDEAITIYQEIIAHTPEYSRARYRIGEMLLARGDTRGASEQVDEVLKANPRDMQALMLRARIRLQSGQSKEVKDAIEDLKEVLKQEPNSRAGLYYMAEANFRANQPEQARIYAAELERYHPDYLPAKLMQAQISLVTGDDKNALNRSSELLELISKTGPDSNISAQLMGELRLKALTTRGSAYLRMNNTKAARADMEAARDTAPNSPGVYSNLAAVSLRENKQDEAIGLFERALDIDKANFDALNGLINIYVSQKRLDQAHARVDQALAAQPNFASLHYLKAQVYGFERNGAGAETELRKAIEIEPNYLPAYFSLGALFVNLNQQERAIAEYRRILEKRPDDASAYTLIGMLEDSRQNFDAAAESYRKALELDPNSAIAANNLAWLYATRNMGNLDEAVRLAQGIVQRYPDQMGFVDTLGWVYYKKNLYAAAVEQLKKVVAKDEKSATYRFHLGMAMAAGGDKVNARRELEQALRLGEERGNFNDAEEARKTLATL
ncbi:MAG TPA: tetratricopeptide repeat protein [Pyrinomonadaceae bacterium]|jgi:tetratricopeptide (TPR) repeat protein|nr:tetratricopeptide repeat protein [Pyrinomonadaceae bacterium]